MSTEDPNVTVAKFSFKQAIIVAAITGATTLGGTLLTMKSANAGESPEKDPTEALSECEARNDQLAGQLEAAVAISSLSDISDTHFAADATADEVKSTVRALVNNANQYERDSKHFMHKLFRLKKLMLANGGNINVRVSNANPEACKLIQDLLKGIEYYRGTLDGNVESTRQAVEEFQRNQNRFTPDYFEERNIGIVGKKTFNAILEHYERS